MVSAFLDGERASIHFQSPATTLPKEEQLPILSYAVTVQPGGRRILFTGRNVITLQDGKHVTFGVVNGLKAGQEYSFRVSAVNVVGEGEGTVAKSVAVSNRP